MNSTCQLLVYYQFCNIVRVSLYCLFCTIEPSKYINLCVLVLELNTNETIYLPHSVIEYYSLSKILNSVNVIFKNVEVSSSQTGDGLLLATDRGLYTVQGNSGL